MTPVAKGGIALAIPALAGAYPLYRFLTSEGDLPVALVELDATVGTDYSSKFGEEYGRYMMDPRSEKNKELWESSFRKIEKEKNKIKDLFNHEGSSKDTEVKKGYGAKNDTEALNNVCDTIYKAEKTNVDENGGSTKYKDELVWKHCSIFGEKPKTIEKAGKEGDYSTPESALGKEKKDKLVSIEDNDKFWSFQEARFNRRDLKKFTLEESPFKKVREGKSAKQTVKDLCLTEYKKTESTITSYKNDFWEFCSLSGKEN